MIKLCKKAIEDWNTNLIIRQAANSIAEHCEMRKDSYVYKLLLHDLKRATKDSRH